MGDIEAIILCPMYTRTKCRSCMLCPFFTCVVGETRKPTWWIFEMVRPERWWVKCHDCIVYTANLCLNLLCFV